MRYIAGILIAIGLVILTIILIVKAFTGGGGAPAPQQIDLNSYASTAAVMQMTIDGPINADQIHHQIRISVGRDKTTIDVLQGYEGDVAKSRTFHNNQKAYAEFLHALNVAGFTHGNSDPNIRDESGYCPTGQRYVYEALSGGDDILRWWKTSCGQGNFGGRSDVVRNLFKSQVPDYNKLTTGFGLY